MKSNAFKTSCKCSFTKAVMLNSFQHLHLNQPSFKAEEALNKGSFRAPLRFGFTLIELLVVVLIIGILAAVAVPQYQKAVDKTRVSELFAIVKNLKMQQELFYLANGHYAENCEELGADLPAGAEEDSDDAGGYRLPGNPYFVFLKCNHGSRVMGITAGPGINVHIETYFDHIPDTPEYQGKSYCQVQETQGRSMDVCKSLGKEKWEENAYWL